MNAHITLFLKGAAAAFFAGVVATAAVYFGDPAHFTIEHLKAFVPVGVASGLAGLALYLQHSPLGEWKFSQAGGIDRRGGNAETITVRDVLKGEAPAKLPNDAPAAKEGGRI